MVAYHPANRLRKQAGCESRVAKCLRDLAATHPIRPTTMANGIQLQHPAAYAGRLA